MTLYELTARQEVILSMLDSIEDGEIPDDLAAELDALDESIPAKVDSICQIIASLSAEAGALHDEASRLSNRAASADNKAESLRRYLQGCLERSGTAKVKTPRFTVWVQASPPSVQFNGEPTEVPEQFQRITVAVDKSKAMEVYKSGGKLPPGFTVSQSTHLRIK